MCLFNSNGISEPLTYRNYLLRKPIFKFIFRGLKFGLIHLKHFLRSLDEKIRPRHKQYTFFTKRLQYSVLNLATLYIRTLQNACAATKGRSVKFSEIKILIYKRVFS
jgi:hypothetical protein